MTAWKTIRIGDVCSKIGSGATPRGGDKAYLSSGKTSLIRSQNIYNDGFRKGGIVYLSDDDAANLAGVTVLEHDVLLNITGDSVARICQVDPDVLPARVNQHVAIVRPDPNLLDPRFLRYVLVSPPMQNHLLSCASAGATRNALTKSMIESIEIEAPSLPEQRAIAHILGTLEDKIELNRRMSQTLEEIARALFKSWFVDFDPVHAKAAGRQPVGMDAATAALFPSEFEESELGLIPKGWRVSTIGEEVQVVGGSTPSTKNATFWEYGEHAWATPKDLAALRSPILLTTERRITAEGLRQISSGQLPVGTVLLSSRAPVGYLAIARIPVSVNQGFIAMVCNQDLTAQFALLWAQENIETIRSRANGTTFQEISKANFRPILVLVPDKGTIAAFTSATQSYFDRLYAALVEVDQLTTVRDGLLPLLISGKLTVATIPQPLETVL